MRTGLMIGAADLAELTIEDTVVLAQKAESRGFASLWMAHVFGLDAISTLAMVGQQTSSISLGTAVTPTYPRHPTAIAQQALTAGAAAGGRFTLGIGLSHQIVIEGMFGLSYDKPAKHMKEYLTILGPLLKGQSVTYAGEQFNSNNVTLQVPGYQPVPLLVAALGPVMLKLAGELADGTMTWMTGPGTLADYVIPTIRKSASAAGKPDPTIAAGFPIVLTNDPEGTREHISKALQVYGMLPSYRSMLDKEGVAGPAELAIAGDETELRGDIQQLKDIGVTDFCAVIAASDIESFDRTFEFLASEIDE